MPSGRRHRASSPSAWSSISLRLLAVLSLGTAPLAVQSVSPPIIEVPSASRSTSGTLILTNESIFPLVAVIDVRGFTVDSLGTLRDVPIDTSRVKVKLSQLSARLAARQQLTVFYDIEKKDDAPVWLQIMSAFSGARAANGLALRIELPHVVYLYQKAALTREDVRVVGFGVDRAAGKAVLVLENTSDKLGRSQDVQLSAPGAPTQKTAAFPFFPHSRRVLLADWTSETAPALATIRFSGFTIETGPVGTVRAPGTAPTALAADSAAAGAPSAGTP